MDLWFALHGALHPWSPRRCLQGLQEKRFSPASSSPSISLGPTGRSQHHSSCPSAFPVPVLDFQAVKAAFQMVSNTSSFVHIIIFAETSKHWHFPAAYPWMQLFKNSRIWILSTANFKCLTHLPVKFTNTLNESGFLLVEDLYFCCSENAVPNNTEAGIYSSKNTYWEKYLFNLSKPIVN